MDVTQLNYTADLSTEWGTVSFKHYFLDDFEMKMEAKFEESYASVKSEMRAFLKDFLGPLNIPLYLRYLNLREEKFPALMFQQQIK